MPQPKRKSNKAKYRVPAPAGVSTWRFFLGKLFGSIEHWWKVLAGIAIVIAVVRANASDLPPIVASITQALGESGALAWAITVCVVLSSIVVIRFMIWRHGKEIDRITAERDTSQEQLMQRKVRSSLQK